MILKSILIVHRYLGVILGVLMTVWCLSGFVMMYQDFPDASRAERMAGLERLDLSACCNLDLGLPDNADIRGLRIEMLAGTPVLRLQGDGPPRIIDLKTGDDVVGLGESDIRRTMIEFAAGNAISGDIGKLEQIGTDQWTAALARRQAPVWRAKFTDPSRTWVYVSGRTGEVFQHAKLHERWLSWFGAVPHWLYPTILRENQPLWSQVVIWLSLAGTFLTVTGLFVGVSKLRSKAGRWFPYRRPMWLVHHMVGFFSGLLVLTWVFSGLLTMAPWGWFESPPTVDRSAVITSTTWADVRPALAQAIEGANGDDVVQIRLATLLGSTSLIAELRDGTTRRFDATGAAALSAADVAHAIEKAPGPLATGVVDLLQSEDAYYYGHKQAADLPVIRIQLDDEQRSRIYLDPDTGEARRFVGATAKRYRWLESGFHSFDFPVLRARPFWDIVVLLLLTAVTVICATGAWMSFTRVRRDVSGLRSRLSRRR